MHKPGHFKHNTLLLALSTSALVMLPMAANAVVVSVPNSARPENVQRQLQYEDKRPDVSGAPIISIQDQNGKEIKGNVSFTLKSVQFEDGKELNLSELGQFYQNKIGKSVTLGELNQVASNITSYYRNKGFILTRAVVPPQRINNGAVKIRIIEGYVNDVQLKGDVGSANSVLYKYAEKIKQSKPLNAATLERYLLLMEDLPGVQARAVLQPSPTTPGASQIIVNITRRTLEGSTVQINNRGTRFMGPVQGTAILAGNNLMKMDEQTSIRGINSIFYPDELKYVGARHEMQLGSEGTKLVLDGNFVATKPGYTLEPFDVRGENYTVDAQVVHPILRSRQSNWFVNTDFSVQRANLSALDTNLYLDNLRVWTVGSSYDFIDSTTAVNRFEGAVSKGFDWDAGNDGLAHSRANGKQSFWKATANATRIQPIYGKWSAQLAVDGQYSNDPLFAAAEYTLGGQQFLTAFDPAEISGDSGVSGRMELQYNGTSDSKFFPSYQPYVFYDLGRVWNQDVIAASERKTASLSSTGAGMRFNIADSVTGSGEIAFPINHKVATAGQDGDSLRIFLNLQYRY